ncbi:MAG: hypothetical protein A2798_03930 [Candidatus Levybacteria bacterium RIFCSPHIGHO2_01_FULL_37_17]|nr:MAG: hypothetical protein A2798_03930 [Candidatus Levybacteria bacterium RIFCSPHIGHO2_01_FULL_37_17]OGH36617.1 MAG: hypothetical protein A2959_03985 [Candidatus Levybacteria bacterium RIFCSPLOWO2_01_FULL_38_23]
MDPNQAQDLPIQNQAPIQPAPSSAAPPPPVETTVPPQGNTPVPVNKSRFSNKWVIVGIILLFMLPIILALGYFFVLQNNSQAQPSPVPTVVPIESPTDTPTPIPSDTPTPTPEEELTPTATPTAALTP